MLPTTHRSHRSTIPATGLGSILVVVPQLALQADRGVVAEVAVAVGMGEGSFTAMDRRPWADVTVPGDDRVGDAAADGSANPDAGRVDAGRTDGGVTRDIGASSDVDDTPIVLPPSSRGCQCSTTDQKVDTRWAALGLAFGAVVVARRRRR